MRAFLPVVLAALASTPALADLPAAKFASAQSEAASVGRISEMVTRCAVFPGEALVKAFVDRNVRQGASEAQLAALKAKIEEASKAPRSQGFDRCPPEPGFTMMTEEIVKLWRGTVAER